MPAVTVKTYRILNITEPSEYNALSAAYKEAYKVAISAFVVDLEPGTPVYNNLWAMFPEGSTTGDALRDPANRFLVHPAEEE